MPTSTYTIISTPIENPHGGASAAAPAAAVNHTGSENTLIFEITADKKAPRIAIFTKDNQLIDHLLLHGYTTGNSLTAQLISYLGHRRSKELLKQHLIDHKTTAVQNLLAKRQTALTELLNKKRDGDTSIKDYQIKNAQAKVKILEKSLLQLAADKTTSEYNHQLICDLQQQIKNLSEEERGIAFDNAEQQRLFKDKLANLLQSGITKYKKHHRLLKPKAVQLLLSDAINLVDAFIFPASSDIHPDKNFSGADQTGYLPLHSSTDQPDPQQRYFIDPNKLIKISNAFDYRQFILAVNSGDFGDNSHKIDESKLDELPALYKPFFDLSNVIKYISNYKIRTAVCFTFAILEMYFLIPALAPIAKTIYFLNMFGLGNPIVLFCSILPFTVTAVNLLFSLPEYLKYFKTTAPASELTGIADTILDEQKLSYRNLFRLKQTLYIKKSYQTKSSNIIWHVPFLYYTVAYLEKKLDKYSFWYFSYIQRNPIGFSMYLLFKSAAFIAHAIHLTCCTFFRLEQVADSTILEEIKAQAHHRHHAADDSEHDDVRNKIQSGSYVLLVQNNHGEFSCYRKDADYPYSGLNIDQLYQLYINKSVDEQDRNPVYVYIKPKWQPLTEVNYTTLQTAQRIAIPQYWIPTPTFSQKIYSTFNLSFISALTKQILLDLTKMFLIRIPASVLYILINRFIVSVVYLSLFLIINIIAIPFRLTGFIFALDKLVALDCLLLAIYNKTYRKLFSYFERINNYIDKKITSRDFSIVSQMMAVRQAYNTPAVTWLQNHHAHLYEQAKQLEEFLSMHSVDINQFNKQLELNAIRKQAIDKLSTFYRHITHNFEVATGNTLAHSVYSEENLRDELIDIMKYTSLLDGYLQQQFKFSSSYVKEHKFDYLLTVLKIKIAGYLIDSPAHRIMADKLFDDCKKLSKDTSQPTEESLIIKLFELKADPHLPENLKTAVIDACIEQSKIVSSPQTVRLLSRYYDLQKSRAAAQPTVVIHSVQPLRVAPVAHSTAKTKPREHAKGKRR